MLQKSLTPQQLRQLSPTSLAYVGDAVYELYVRQRYLFPPRRTHRYHQQVVAQVRAERQAEQLRLIQRDLTDEERDVIRRGRNATTRPPKRLDPKIYQEATGLEALIGYLYLTDSERLFELLSRFNFED
ncbi:ribonuclease III [Phormidium yuhuli AB48]|uniref:Mini-ribonuclease 3 n=1 Tax=Phormidium yuhuli AB48 TaxID=2940671 RepID=A0ABY5APZ5_9CYAN|nr:ribonuclease III domain-containing protein [Phormidium yuhuli]USR90976.1 ribonuclease III [Phormidium yuhuli AB48]